jgi:pectate disaccharide-lyase
MRYRLRYFFLTMFCMFSLTTAQQKTYWTESFESSNWPSSSSSSETSVSISETGTWKVASAYRYTAIYYSGSSCLYVAGGGYFITPTFSNGVKEIQFYSKSTGSARTITVAVSKDGSTFDTSGTTSSGSSSGWSLSSYTISDTSVKAVKMISSGGTVYFDDVTLVSMITPTITSSTSSITDFGIVQSGSSSSAASFTVSGTNLSDNVTVVAPSGFKASSDNSSFNDSITLTESSGTLSSTTVYVKFSPDSATGTTSGNINLESTDASTVSINVSGTAISTQPTTASSVSTGSITGSTVVLTISGGNGQGRVVAIREAKAVEWTPTDGAEPSGISSDYSSATALSDSSRPVYLGTGNTVTVSNLSSGTTYYVAVYEYNGTASGSENYLTTSGTADFTTVKEPGLSITPSSLAFGNVVQDVTSSEKTISISGKYLTPASGSVTVTAPTGFAVSQSSGSGFSSSLSLSYSDSTLSATSIYVNFTPTSESAYSDSISVSGGGASTKEIKISGNGVDSANLYIKIYYVDSTGNDANSGTIDAPFYSVSAAIALAKAGDTIYVRGGTYYYDTTVYLTESGTSDSWRITLINYPGEHPVFNFSNQPYGADNRGFLMTGNYWHIKGIEICYAGDNGIKLEGNHNLIERCIFHHNGDSGIQLGFGHSFEDSHPGISSNDGSYCAYNYILNCDSYYNYDSDSKGGDADGFACKMHNGIGNVFRYCRSWHNSDDGWDLFETDYAVVMDYCWTWASGVDQGNGNGFKLGGDGTGGSSMGTHVVSHGVSFGHKTNGFTNNSHKDGERITNCISFSNGSSAYNYFFEGSHNSGKADTFYNCASITSKGGADSGLTYDDAPVESNNSWNLGISVTSADFSDLSEDAAGANRQDDGSLPTGFARLVAGSNLIDKGINVGEAYTGKAPDIGPFEYGMTGASLSSPSKAIEPGIEGLKDASGSGITFRYTITKKALTTLKLYNALGRRIASLVNEEKMPGKYSAHFNSAGLGKGMYVALLTSGGNQYVCKLVKSR